MTRKTSRRRCSCEKKKKRRRRRKTEFLAAVGLWRIIIVITITVIQHHIASLVCMCSPRRRRGFSVWCFVFFISWLSSGESWFFFILSPLKKKWQIDTLTDECKDGHLSFFLSYFLSSFLPVCLSFFPPLLFTFIPLKSIQTQPNVNTDVPWMHVSAVSFPSYSRYSEAAATATGMTALVGILSRQASRFEC